MKLFNAPIKIPEKREALLALTLAAIILGVNAPVAKWTLQFISIESLAFLRFFIAFVIFYALFRPNLTVKNKDLPLMMLNGFIGVALHIPLLYIGLTLTNAINAAIIASSIPIMSMFFSKYFLKEKISLKLITGGVIGLAGVLLIIFEPLIKTGLASDFVGNIFLVGSALTFVIYEIMSKKLAGKKYNPKTISMYSYLIGFVCFLPFFAADYINNGLYFLNHQVLIGGVFIILLSSVTAIPLWQWGISRLAVSRVGFFLYLDPIAAFIVGYFLLGELITFHMLIGAILIFFGLYVAENTLHFPHFHLYHAHMKKRRER